jgi:hypothetical protein
MSTRKQALKNGGQRGAGRKRHPQGRLDFKTLPAKAEQIMYVCGHLLKEDEVQ